MVLQSDTKQIHKNWINEVRIKKENETYLDKQISLIPNGNPICNVKIYVNIY